MAGAGGFGPPFVDNTELNISGVLVVVGGPGIDEGGREEEFPESPPPPLVFPIFMGTATEKFFKEDLEGICWAPLPPTDRGFGVEPSPPSTCPLSGTKARDLCAPPEGRTGGGPTEEGGGGLIGRPDCCSAFRFNDNKVVEGERNSAPNLTLPPGRTPPLPPPPPPTSESKRALLEAFPYWVPVGPYMEFAREISLALFFIKSRIPKRTWGGWGPVGPSPLAVFTAQGGGTPPPPLAREGPPP